MSMTPRVVRGIGSPSAPHQDIFRPRDSRHRSRDPSHSCGNIMGPAATFLQAGNDAAPAWGHSHASGNIAEGLGIFPHAGTLPHDGNVPGRTGMFRHFSGTLQAPGTFPSPRGDIMPRREHSQPGREGYHESARLKGTGVGGTFLHPIEHKNYMQDS